MKIIKSFKIFKEDLDTKQMPIPSREKPDVIVEPGRRTRPERPSPIRRSRPGVEPAPKAKLPKEGTIEGVIERFAKLTNQ
jgi:hypothetical protein